MEGIPLVSIRCTVYNHEPFLRQCLDGFVMQQTTFPFEAIVHDDASTDGSAAIIREYAEKYPDIIKPIYESENQYSKHDGSILSIMDAAIHPDSKYIAVCEGDDYWTDPNKLQIQVDFLESHPDFVICSHDYRCYHQEDDRFNDHSCYEWFFGDKICGLKTYTYTLDTYFDGWWTQPLTCLYRKGDYLEEIKRKHYSSLRDDVFYYNVLTHGKGMLFVSVMGIYRIHSGGVWSLKEEQRKLEDSRRNAMQIYQIEGDKNAFKIIRSSTVRLIMTKKEKGYTGRLKKEILFYYHIAPFDEFLCFLKVLLRNLIGRAYHRLISRFKLKRW